MIATVSIRVSAANPQAPLGPFYVYEGSAASVTIIDVPRKFGEREITGVSLLARNVMDEERGIPCVRVGSAWGATVPDTFYTRSGQINDNGFVVQAEGVDENGDPVVWILGRSTVLVMDATGYILPNAVRKYVRWNLTVPAKPELGDMCILGDGSVAIYTERLWQRIGVSGNPISRDDVAGVLPLPSQFSENQMRDKINELLSHLKGTVALAFAAFGFAALGGVTVQTAPKGEVLNTQPIVTNVVYEADSLARPLPKYLHALDFYDSYPAEAAWYYEQRGSGALAASCSAVRDGNTLSRNFDYPFDDRAEFVVKMAAGAGRFASVGVAQVGTNITEAMATSGKQLPPQFYKALPGATVDGVNENGVVCEINVVDGEPAWHTGGDIHPLGAVRWALDRGTSAAMVASNLALRIAFPQGWAQNYHYMIADERETWIVENGAAHLVDGTAVMTNFRLYPTHSGGEGQERYALLAGGAAITNAWFTRAYLRTTNWTSEFKDAAEMEAAKSAWETHTKEQLRGKGLWQSVHTSIYDITNRTLRVAVQESADFYTFAVPVSSGIKTETDPTVPAWAKQATPPEGMTENALVWTNNAVRTKDGAKTIGAADVGAADIDDFDFLDSFVRTNTIPKTNRIFYNDDPAYGAWHFMGYADGLRISSGTAAYSPSITYDNSIGMWKMKNPHIGSDLIAGHKDIAFSINSLSNSVMPIALSARDNAFSADTKATAAQTAASAADAKANAAQTHSEETRAMIAATNATFSAAVLGVGVDWNFDACTNAVAALNDFKDAFGDLGTGDIIGGTATLGSLLLALLAAVTWLKKNALTDGLETDGTPTDEKLDKFFADTNSLLTATIHDCGGVQYDADGYFINIESGE